jgi:nucleoside-diphosphate-sugar epimerase
MRKNILLIGGTRFIGKMLVQRLLTAGHQVTIATRGRTPDPFGTRISRIKVDRRDERAMLAAFANAPLYDVVYDQLCFSPRDAAIAVNVFTGKVKRYVMTSSIDVYRGLLGQQDAPFAESDLDIMAQTIDTDYPWHDAAMTNKNYVAGKVQAEAYLYRDGSLPLVTVRLGHVLGGTEDFTGRTAHYVDLVRMNAPLRYSSAAAASSFLSAQSASCFLAWVGTQDFTGPVNAACGGALSAFDLAHRVGIALDAPVSALPVTNVVRTGELSPFDYAHPFMLDTARAGSLGFCFSHCDDWLDRTIRQHDLAYV